MTTRPQGRGRPLDYQARRTITAVVAGRVANGERLKDIFADRSGGLPSREAFLAWMRRDLDLGAIYRRARRSNPRHWTPGQPFHYLPAIGEAICAHLMEGWTLRDICAHRLGMPSQATVYRWLIRHEDFAKMYGEARQAQAHRLFDEALEVAEHATETSWRRDKLKIDTIRWTVAKLAPDRYGPQPKTPAAEARRPVWNIYVQKFGEDDDSAELVQSYELNPGGGIYDPDRDEG